MIIKAVQEQKGTLQKLKNLLNDPTREVHGVFYTNSFFSKRYLSRSHALVDSIDLKENTVKLTVSTRVEPVGLMEIENTIDKLEQHKAGDVPGFIQEGMFDESGMEPQPLIPEFVATTQQLYSIDIFLILDIPTITYQEFKIAGHKFTLVNIYHTLDNDFGQTVTLLFGDSDKMYFLSHLFDENLSVRDSKIVLDLIMEENITGRVIKGMKITDHSGVGSFIYPYGELISAYYNQDGDYIFGMGAGYIRIPKGEISSYKMECIPQGKTGHYQINLTNSRHTITLNME